MVKNMSVVFSGDDINDINESILDYVDSLKTDDAGDEPVTSAAKKKAATAKRKAAVNKKVAVVEEEEEFGEEENGKEDDGLGDDDLEGNGEITLEDVRDILGELQNVRDPKIAKKVLQKFGDTDRLDELDESLYIKVYEKAQQLIAKANA